MDQLFVWFVRSRKLEVEVAVFTQALIKEYVLSKTANGFSSSRTLRYKITKKSSLHRGS